MEIYFVRDRVFIFKLLDSGGYLYKLPKRKVCAVLCIVSIALKERAVTTLVHESIEIQHSVGFFM